MTQRELSLEEANKLCQSALILICQENQQLKQKKAKARQSPQLRHPSISFSSPQKTTTSHSKADSLEKAFFEFALTQERSPLKNERDTCHKLSIDRQSSLGDLLEIQEDSKAKTTGRLHCRLQRFYSLPTHLGETQIMPTHLQKQIEPIQASQIVKDQAQKLIQQGVIKQLKRDLEIKSRGKICKTQEIDQEGKVKGYHLYCRSDQDCPFHCFLEDTQLGTGHNRLYRLVVECEQHLQSCIESEEEMTYLRLTKLVDSMEEWIVSLVQEKGWLKPKDILIAMAVELGEDDHRFIYRGLSSKSYQKAAKKYFDNLVYRIKNPL